MNEKSTEELEDVLGNTHVDGFSAYCEENRESLVTDPDDFCTYLKELFREKGVTQQTVFLQADIPERYGYKLLSGEKKTRQRDIVLRICYAAGLTLRETQCALEKYGMPHLYARVPRDAFLMIVFNDRPGSIIDVNELLLSHEMAPLRTSGLQD